MTTEQAIKFLKAIRASNVQDGGGGWVRASCPLAPWKHKSAHDKNPSFGLHVSQTQRAHFHCFTCMSGSIEILLQTLEMYIMPELLHLYDFNGARQIMHDEELEIVPLNEYDEFGSYGQVFEEWPAWWFDSFKSVTWFQPAVDYLTGRGIPTEEWEKYDLRFDPHRQMIMFPYRNVYGKFAGARGRSILPDVSGPKKHYDYSFQDKNNAKLVWYNEEALNLDGPAVGVEGQVDAIVTLRGWPKTLGNLTAKPTEAKFKKLCDSGMFVHITDNDEAGEQSAIDCSSLAKKFGILYRRFKLAPSVKDPAECHPMYLRDGILKAISGVK